MGIDNQSEFLGVLLQALIVLVPIFSVCYIAIMGQVRKQIRLDVEPVDTRQQQMGREMLALERRMGEDIQKVSASQNLLAADVGYIRKSLERLESMVASLLRDDTQRS